MAVACGRLARCTLYVDSRKACSSPSEGPDSTLWAARRFSAPAHTEGQQPCGRQGRVKSALRARMGPEWKLTDISQDKFFWQGGEKGTHDRTFFFCKAGRQGHMISATEGKEGIQRMGAAFNENTAHCHGWATRTVRMTLCTIDTQQTSCAQFTEGLSLSSGPQRWLCGSR